MRIDWDLLNSYLSKYEYSINETRRFQKCPLCGQRISRKGFVVTRTPKGFLCWCHSCHHSYSTCDKIPAYGECLRTANELQSSKTWYLRKRSKQQPTKDVATAFVKLPFDVTIEIPTSARLWLMKYHVTQEEVQQHGICWSPQYQRLILPVRDSCGKLLYWQGRYFGSESGQPKYLNVKANRGEVWFDTGNKDSAVIVLVEDILSAIAVARTGSYRAVALLGSFISDDLVLKLLREGKQVCVWLDLDKRCQSVKYSKRLQAFGIQAKSIVTNKDPKEYTPQQITKEVSHAYPDQEQSHPRENFQVPDGQRIEGQSDESSQPDEQSARQVESG